MFDGQSSMEIDLITRVKNLEDLLVSVRTVCARKEEQTARKRLDARIASFRIGSVTAKTFKL